MIDETTMREEFSDLTLLKGDRFLAGSYVAYTLQIDEVVSRKAIGEVAEFDFEARQTPIGEDLPTFVEDEA